MRGLIESRHLKDLFVYYCLLLDVVQKLLELVFFHFVGSFGLFSGGIGLFAGSAIIEL